MESLRVVTAIADPPLRGDDGGLDIDLIQALAERLGATTEFVEHRGEHQLFAALGSTSDCITGVTVTPELEKTAAFLPPYLICGQALAVDTGRSPRVRSVDDLAGRTIGVEDGSTGQTVAERLVAEGHAARVCARDSVRAALADLDTGAGDAVIALDPVLTRLITPMPRVEVVQRGLTVEHIAIAVAAGDQALLGRLTVAQAELEADGTLQEIRRRWLGNPYADQSLAVH